MFADKAKVFKKTIEKLSKLRVLKLNYKFNKFPMANVIGYLHDKKTSIQRQNSSESFNLAFEKISPNSFSGAKKADDTLGKLCDAFKEGNVKVTRFPSF